MKFPTDFLVPARRANDRVGKMATIVAVKRRKKTSVLLY